MIGAGATALPLGLAPHPPPLPPPPPRLNGGQLDTNERGLRRPHRNPRNRALIIEPMTNPPVLVTHPGKALRVETDRLQQATATSAPSPSVENMVKILSGDSSDLKALSRERLHYACVDLPLERDRPEHGEHAHVRARTVPVLPSSSGKRPHPMTPSPPVGTTIIVVHDRDIDHFVLQLREGARVSGRVTFEGAVRPEATLVTSTSVYLDRLDERSSGAEPAKPDGFGQFTTAGLPPGTYRLRVGDIRPRLSPFGSQRFGEPEVQHLDRAVAPHFDVCGLEVAMDDPVLVRGFERLCDLSRDRECLFDWNRPAGDVVRKRLAINELQREGICAGVLLEAVDPGNVRVVERSQCARLPLEAAQSIGVGREDLRQDLQSDVTLELWVTRPINFPHTPGPDDGDDFIGANLEFPGFSGQTLASGFSRRGDAKVQAPDPRKSPFDVRIH